MQKKSYLTQIKNLEKCQERKNVELEKLRTNLANTESALNNLRIENQNMRAKLDTGKCDHIEPAKKPETLILTSVLIDSVKKPESLETTDVLTETSSPATCHRATHSFPPDTSTCSSKTDIIIAGASNTNFLKPNQLNRSLEASTFSKIYCGNIAAAEEKLVPLQDSPDIFILNVGTNDLRSHREPVPSVLSRYVDMVTAILNRHVNSKVLVSLLPPRIDSKYYYEKTDYFNAQLCLAMSEFDSDRIFICNNDNLDMDHLYHNDGIHLLRNSGVRWLARNILDTLRCMLDRPLPRRPAHLHSITRDTPRPWNSPKHAKRKVQSTALSSTHSYDCHVLNNVHQPPMSSAPQNGNFWSSHRDLHLSSCEQSDPSRIPQCHDFMQPTLILPPPGFTMPPPGFAASTFFNKVWHSRQ
jgi:lysophospholipase L1-like esterase/regulator of replication initiation timing